MGLKVYRLLLRAATKTITEGEFAVVAKKCPLLLQLLLQLPLGATSLPRQRKSYYFVSLLQLTWHYYYHGNARATTSFLCCSYLGTTTTTTEAQQVYHGNARASTSFFFVLQLLWHYCYHEGTTSILQRLSPLLLLFRRSSPSLVVHCRYFECNGVVVIIVLFAGDAELEPHQRTRQPLCLSDVSVLCATDVVAIVEQDRHHRDMFKHYG